MFHVLHPQEVIERVDVLLFQFDVLVDDPAMV